jgi:hypothetical protein
MTTIDDPEDEPTDPKIKETIEKIISFSDRLKSGIREGETWHDFQWAAELIRDRLDCSPGMARQILRELCESGDVRSISCAEEERAISPGEWAKEALDLRPGCAVEVSMWDLAYSLDDPVEEEEPTNTATDGRTSKKRALASQAIKALWPDGIPEIPNGEIEKQVGNWITNYCKQNNTRRLEISPDTILRAAGRK